MNPQAGPDVGAMVSALMSGKMGLLVMLVLGFAVVQYGAYALRMAAEHLSEFWAWCKGKANSIPLLAATQIDDRFFDLLDKACSNQANLLAAMKTAFADTDLTPDEMKSMAEAIWADFKANTGVHDLASFGQAMLGNAQAPGAERALRAKFDANVHRLLAPHLHEASSRAMQRSMAKAQARSMRAQARALEHNPQACSVPTSQPTA